MNKVSKPIFSKSTGVKFLVFIMLSFLHLPEVSAQSMSYDFLLKTLYKREFPVITTSEAKSEEFLFLDIREWKEYSTSHIKDALYVGYKDFDLEKVKNVSKDTPIVVYCSIGVRSQEIGERLKQAGYTHVLNLYGGIFQWVNDGLAVYNENGQTNKIHAYTRMWGIWLNKGEKVYE